MVVVRPSHLRIVPSPDPLYRLDDRLIAVWPCLPPCPLLFTLAVSSLSSPNINYRPSLSCRGLLSSTSILLLSHLPPCPISEYAPAVPKPSCPRVPCRCCHAPSPPVDAFSHAPASTISPRAPCTRRRPHGVVHIPLQCFLRLLLLTATPIHGTSALATSQTPYRSRAALACVHSASSPVQSTTWYVPRVLIRRRLLIALTLVATMLMSALCVGYRRIPCRSIASSPGVVLVVELMYGPIVGSSRLAIISRGYHLLDHFHRRQPSLSTYTSIVAIPLERPRLPIQSPSQSLAPCRLPGLRLVHPHTPSLRFSPFNT